MFPAVYLSNRLMLCSLIASLACVFGLHVATFVVYDALLSGGGRPEGLRDRRSASCEGFRVWQFHRPFA